ncbi:hypothetical protein [Lyngbya sp. CCY1209]|jgi:hypothetical protein|nr:hypothetical protein [Lyngbya sp. CCY1209]
MEPNDKPGFEKIRPILSIATFIILAIGVGFLSINLIVALIDKFG